MIEGRVPKIILDMAIKHYKTELRVIEFAILAELVECNLSTFDQATQPSYQFVLGYPHDTEGGWYPWCQNLWEDNDELDQLTLWTEIIHLPIKPDAPGRTPKLLNTMAKVMRNKCPLQVKTAVHYPTWGWYV